MDKKGKIMRTCGCFMMAASIACYSIGGAYAYQSNELRVTNTIQTGDVDIAINETQLAADGETIEPFENNQTVVPGDTVSKIVTVKNLASDCYVRMKVQYLQPIIGEDAINETIPEGSLIELQEGIYYIGEEIEEGTYTFVEGQETEYQLTSYYISDTYTKEVLMESLIGYYTDEEESEETKEQIRDKVNDLVDELGICESAADMEYCIERTLKEIKSLLPSKYLSCVSNLNFNKKETENYPANGQMYFSKGEILTVPKDAVLQMVLKETYHLYELKDLYLNGISDKWVKAADGYYYYKDIVPTGTTIQFFDSISFPTEWTEEFDGFTCGLEVTSEAVQAANFTPDYEADAPWGDTEIEVCIHENDGTVKSKEKNENIMVVSLDATTAQMITNAKDFFADFGEMLPGDTKEDSLLIENKNNHDAEIFFHTEVPEGLTDEQLDLLKNLQLTISMDGKTIYEGNLESDKLSDKISLGTYKQNENGKITFQVHMPEEDKNIYALRDTKIIWVFDCGWTDSYDAPKTGIYDELQRNTIIGGTLLLTAGILLILSSKKNEKKQSELFKD